MEDKYIGLALSVTSTLAIGSSFVITKKGLNDAKERHGFEGEDHSYLKSPIWWAGILTLAAGEVANFAAYAFAPAILVTPLGALSVLIGSVLGSYFLNEKLGTLGKLGCATCLIGSLIIVLHAPPDEDIQTVDEILHYALQYGFLAYCTTVGLFASVMIYRVAPKYGRTNPLIYLSICSSVGSISVMSIKAFGIALKLTLGGNNQFTHPSTYVFVIVVLVCILTQMNYFNKALSQFSTNIVNPLYYVTFTTCTLCASFILFGGFNTTDAVNTISLLCGFLVIFSGVYLLNLSRDDPEGHRLLSSNDEEMDGVPTDAVAGFSTRLSMQSRRSSEIARGVNGGGGIKRSGSFDGSLGRGGRASVSQSRLIHSYPDDEEVGMGLANGGGQAHYGLGDLASSDEEGKDGDEREMSGKRMNYEKYPRKPERGFVGN